MTREALIAALVGLAVFTSLAHGATKKSGHVANEDSLRKTVSQTIAVARDKTNQRHGIS